MKFISSSILLLFALSAYATSPPGPPQPPSPEDVKECLAAILPPDFEFPEPAPTSFEEVKALIKEKLPEFRAKLEEEFKKAKAEAEAAGGDQPAGEEGTPEKRDSEPQKPLPPPPGPPPPGPPPPPPFLRECFQAAVGDVELPENLPPNLDILHMVIMGITGNLPPPPPQ